MNDSTTREGEIIDAQVVDEPSRELAVQSENPYLSMIDRVIDRGGDIANIEKLLDLQQRWDKDQAQKAYQLAVAAFKANPPKVYRDRENKQYGSRYTSLANMVNTVNIALSAHGLNARWDADQSGQIKVTCILSHARGHSESVSLAGPPDTSGAKNSLQQIKSTLTYLKLATFELVTGVASEEGNADDDGNGAGEVDTSTWRDAIEGAADMTELERIGSDLKAAKNIPAPALKSIRAMWAARAKELKAAAK